MKYQVVKGESNYFDIAIRELDAEVEILLNSGWKPQGGISTIIKPHSDYHRGITYYVAQAMVKED